MKEEQIALEDLWLKLISQGNKIHVYNGYEVVDGGKTKVLVNGAKYVPIVWLSRHKTPKHLVEIKVQYNSSKSKLVVVTTDHVCMVYNKDHFFENTNAKDLKVGDFVSVYDDVSTSEVVGSIEQIEDLGNTDEWVYDIEVANNMHAFYADDILVHNSQFINLRCVSQWLSRTKGYPTDLLDWNDDQRRALWNEVYGFVENEVNPFVRKLVRDYCHTSQSNVLTYELEYMSDVGIYEGKKHYATRKRFDEGDPVDKIKWSGIELKKTNVPKEMKLFLQDIYEGALLKKWNNTDYRNYICKLYDRFSKFTIDDISFWKGYNTERQATGFLQMEVGTTGIAKACTFYNQLLKKLNLGKKYDEIRVGDKVRFCYIEPSNDYGIEAIAYKPGQWPTEFAKIFKPNYKKMFDKVILDPLKRFREACKFANFDPSNQMLENIFDM